MPVNYKVIPRRNPMNPEEPDKYHPIVTSTSKISQWELAEKIANMSTLSSADTYAMLEALVSIIPDELASGYMVELGDFGSFFLRIKTTGAESDSEVSSRNITKVLPRFYPGKRFKEALEQIRFVRADRT